jgi:hypothetical protein
MIKTRAGDVVGTGVRLEERGSPSEALRPIWVTPREACRLASVGLTVLYDWMNNGTVISRKVGHKRLILLKSLECLGEDHDGAEGFSPPSLTGRIPASGRRPGTPNRSPRHRGETRAGGGRQATN